jgi:hypothetical protein
MKALVLGVLLALVVAVPASALTSRSLHLEADSYVFKWNATSDQGCFFRARLISADRSTLLARASSDGSLSAAGGTRIAVPEGNYRVRVRSTCERWSVRLLLDGRMIFGAASAAMN